MLPVSVYTPNPNPISFYTTYFGLLGALGLWKRAQSEIRALKAVCGARKIGVQQNPALRNPIWEVVKIMVPFWVP